MPLVDYGSSDESGDEENDTEEVQNEKQPQPQPEVKHSVKDEVDESGDDPTIFSSLPKPRGQMTLHGNVDSLQNLLLNNKSSKSDGTNKRAHVKIAIPSLSDFENDDAPKPEPKKMKPANKQAGLFSVLPPPKNMSVKESKRLLIPHVLKNQMSKPKVETTVNNKMKVENKTVTNVNSAIEDDDDNPTTSYFGEGISELNQKSTVDFTGESSSMPPLPDNNVAYMQPSNSTVDERTAYYPQNYYQSDGSMGEQQLAEYDNLPVNSGPLELDDKALQILCGGKRKRNQMPVNIIDLSGEEIMPDSKQWLLKQLTEEQQKTRTPGQRKSGGPSVQSRRKHQITYLAFQAKAQELELQNQWSNNRMSRRQTQSKYGF